MKWVSQHIIGIEFCRYADDGLLHCKSLKQAEYVLMMITKRFKECALEIHPTKSKIIYCKHALRKEDYENISFTFLGYTFKPRVAMNREGKRYLNFSPGVSQEAMQAMKQTLRKWKLQLKNEWHIKQIAKFINPVLQGRY
jgi:RNA-directed DNA polymerase